MGLKLQSDEESYSDSPRSSATSDSSNYGQTSYHEDGYEDAPDDFSDLEEDTVYIANRYQSDTGSRPVTSENTAVIKKGLPTWATYIMFGLSILLTVLGYIRMSAMISQGGTEVVSSAYSTGYMLILFGRFLIIGDAIMMAVQGNGWGLILWAIFFTPVYYFKRCSANGDSSSIAWIALLLVVASAGFCVHKVYNNVTGGAPSYGSSSTTMDEATVMADFERVYYNINGQKCYLSRIIKDNITEREYRGTTGSTGQIGVITVTGKTMLYGKSQKIEIQIGTERGITKIQIGSKSYMNGGSDDFETVLNDLGAHTQPDTP